MGVVVSLDGRPSSVEGGGDEDVGEYALVEDCLWNFVFHSLTY